MSYDKVGIHHIQNLDTRHATYADSCIVRDSNFWCEETLAHGTYWVFDDEEVLTKYLIFYSYDAIIGVSVWHFNTSHKHGEWSCDSLIENSEFITNRSRTTARHINVMKCICDNGSWYGYCQKSMLDKDALLKWLGDRIVTYSEEA